MASKKDNIKGLFTNTRTRVIIVFTAVLMLTAILIGYFKLRATVFGPESGATVVGAPGSIQSIPGALNPTAQYAGLQEEQNKYQAEKAAQSGNSAIPTIIRTQALGQGVGVIGSTGGQTGVGFTSLSREDEAGMQQSLWIQALKNSNCSKDEVSKAVNQGAQISDLKLACSCTQLKTLNYTLKELEPICDCKALKSAGFDAKDLKDIGFSSDRLRICGFTACEQRAAGFTAQEMRDGGFSEGELKGAGFSDADIAASGGLPPGVVVADVRQAGCDASALSKLREKGVSASAIRRISGCSADQLKAAGFSAKDLKNAGFSAADLKKAGFSPAELKAAGYTARALMDAGYTPADLANAGYSSAEIKAAEAELPPGITAADVKNAGCDVDSIKKERDAGVSAALIKQHAGCSAAALKAAGFTDNDLANAGFTADQIAKAKAVSDADVKAAGCSPDKLKALLAAGVSASRIKTLNGCNAQALKEAGYDAKSLVDAGYTPAELLAAGYTPKQLDAAGINPAALLASGRQQGCNADTLRKAREAGVSALAIKQTLGCSADALKAAGYSADDLKKAGFTAADLKKAGFSPAELVKAGFSPKELHDAGFSADELKNAGLSAKDLKDAGFSADELKKAGFNAAQLKAAGFNAKDLKDAGFSADDLVKAGFKAKDLKDAGFSAAELAKAGLSAKDLKEAGFTAGDLEKAGFTAGELKAAGFTAAELNKAGYSLEDLQKAGFSAADFEVAGLPSPGMNGGGITSIGGVPIAPGGAQATASSNQQLQAILKKQTEQAAEQKYQQKIQQKTSEMLAVANTYIQEWKKVSTQVYVASSEVDEKTTVVTSIEGVNVISKGEGPPGREMQRAADIKMGDILFAVMDTSVNSDEPGPILATIVSGKLKGAKLIGSFTLPANANKMVISFNSMSVPGAPKSISISAFAVDPNTARTALSSNTNHHYLLRYGSLFASSFLQGFGNAIQSANTTVTIGGTGGTGIGNNITITQGIGQSTLQNAVIALATVGKAWGQYAQQLMSTPTTVQVYSGTGLGILFMQDVTI